MILYKLSSYRQDGETSHKHPIDIVKILAVGGARLELAGNEKRTAEIGVVDLWQALWDEFQEK